VSRGRRSPRAKSALVAALVALVVLAGVIIATGGSRAPRRPPPAAAQPVPLGPQSAPLGPPALGAPPAPAFGANVNRLFNDRAYSPRQIASQLAALRRTGATIARSDALWEVAEPRPGAHDWTFDDAIAAALAAAGLRWLPIVDYSPSWASSVPGQDHAPPRSAADYAAFAGAFAARYGPGGAFWRSRPDLTAKPVDTYEIWNEPDNGAFWRPRPDAARYEAMYLAARTAIKEVDSQARVVVGGLTAPSTFLPAMVAARAAIGAHIDGVAIHPYGPTPAGVLADVRDARNVLARLGLTRTPLYVTEFGWSTQPPGTITYLPERVRPSFIAATLVALARADCGVAATTIYTWVTPERHRSDRDDWFGIQPPRGGTSPDAIAFAAALKIASSPGPPLRVCAGSR
jgi:polysaccharide biosynthesis protein PslG